MMLLSPQPGAACHRSRLPGWLRLAITLGVLFALKFALPFAGAPPGVTVVLLLVIATAFAWRFWWNCSPDRRGVAVCVAVLWMAGLIKLLRM